jgi:hypothetical protein
MDKFRKAVARALGLPDKSVTPELAQQYELIEENGELIAKLKGVKL